MKALPPDEAEKCFEVARDIVKQRSGLNQYARNTEDTKLSAQTLAKRVKTHISKRWKTYVYLIICTAVTLVVFSWSSSFLAVDDGKEKSICLELFATPKYSLTVNLTLEIPRVNISAQTVQRLHYNIAKRPDPSANQVVIVNFHLACNETKELNVVVTELEPIEGWGTSHYIYSDLANNGTNNWIIRTYFSKFIMIYTVKTSWLNKLSEIVIFRDAYHYLEGFERENNYTTERTPFLTSALSVTFSLIVFGFALLLRPDLRPISLRYYPWLTISIVVAATLVFLFWTPAQFQISFGLLSVSLSYFSHFNSRHLIGNLKMGVISLFLLESWIGGELGKNVKKRVEILVVIIGSNWIFWIIGMGGFGASFVNEVLGTLLVAYAIYYRRHLTRTRTRSIIYTVACCFAGYALFTYIIDWFVTGYIFHSSVEDANLHLTAFAAALVLVSVSLIVRDVSARRRVVDSLRKCCGLVMCACMTQKRRVAAILAWLGLLILVYIDQLLFKIETYLIFTTYMVVISLALVKYVEKESIRERFGFQKHNLLGLVLGCLVFIIFFILSGRQRIRGVIITPVTEEIFFRGYMLGAISTRGFPEWTQTVRRLIFHIRNKSLKASLKGSVQISPSHFIWAIIISVLFSISHIFVYSSFFPFPAIFIMSLLLAFSYGTTRTILWCSLIHMLYNLYD